MDAQYPGLVAEVFDEKLMKKTRTVIGIVYGLNGAAPVVVGCFAEDFAPVDTEPYVLREVINSHDGQPRFGRVVMMVSGKVLNRARARGASFAGQRMLMVVPSEDAVKATVRLDFGTKGGE